MRSPNMQQSPGSSASSSKYARHQIRLVLKAAVELVAVSRLEMAIEAEVAQNAAGVNDRLRRAEKKPRSLRTQFRKRLFDAVIDDGLEKPPVEYRLR